jgi:hypothetical protein
MGASLNVQGIKPPTKEYLDKLAAYCACEAAGVSVPKEILDFFGGNELRHIEPSGIEVGLTYPQHESLKPYGNDYSEGFDIEIDKLPAGVKILRVYISW